MRRPSTIYATVAILLLSIGIGSLLIGSVIKFEGRFSTASTSLKLAVSAASIVLLAGLISLFWRLVRRARSAEKVRTRATEEMVHAAKIEAEQAEGMIRQLGDESTKVELNKELSEIRAGEHRHEFRVVVFGTGSAGKTSLINALLGREAGKTEAVMGTTRVGENYTYSMAGVDGTVYLTDTPGLSEIGAGGDEREKTARELAARADLLIFVLDQDLIRTEYEPLAALVRLGKRSLVVLNKTDRMTEDDRDAILAKLRERLRGLVGSDAIIACAAAPRPMTVRVRRPDGSIETTLEDQPPDLAALRARIAEILRREGETLRAGNLLLRAHLLSRKAQDQLAKERDQHAKDVIEKFQWMTAGTVFANPFPALELLANGAVQFQMISELATVYDISLSTSDVRMIGGQMIQTLLKLGLVETATTLIAGLFKSTIVGYAAAGAVQGVSMAYLTHISGEAFVEYFRQGRTWGDGGMQAALVRQFDLTSRSEFLQEFARQALKRVAHQFLQGNSKTPEQPSVKP